MKKPFLLLALVVFFEGLAFADPLSPCQPGTLTSIADTSCSIGDASFTFGSPQLAFSPVDFTPDPAIAGFVLSGPVNLVQDPFGGAAELFFLPFVVATINGQPLIFAITSSVTGSTTEDGILQATTALCSTSSSQPDCVFGAASLRGTNPSTLFATVPRSQAFGEAGVFMIVPDHFPGSVTFTSASFEINQVPEPTSLLLMMTGVVCLARRPRKLFLRSK
jgi:hypothetical protein